MASLRYAWRNLWRNWKRTSITLASVILNTAILIASYALMDGLTVHAVRSATNLVVGEVQVHPPGYLADRSIYKSLARPDILLQVAEDNDFSAAPRVYGYGLLSHGTKSAGAMFWGVEPALEREAFDLAGYVVEGDFLEETPGRKIVLGKRLAHSLQVSVGSEIVVVVQAADGSLGNDIYRVAGILKSAGESIDRNATIIHKDDFRELFVMGDQVHEIAFNTRGAIPLEELTALVNESAHGDEVKTWRDLLGPLSDMVNLMDASMLIFGAIFFLAAGLGVMNTMLMAAYERVHEFGVLKALGASPWRIVGDILIEAFVLVFVAILLGTLLGLAGSYYLQVIGLDTSRIAGETSFAGVAFDPIWRAVISPKSVVVPVTMMVITSLLASLYPATLAARLDPVEAMHHV